MDGSGGGVQKEPKIDLEIFYWLVANSCLLKVVLVKQKVKYWPAEVVSHSSETYDVIICGKNVRFTVKKEDCLEFIPGSHQMKGQSERWKSCYEAATIIYNS